jgi:uncharacterized membrane protein
MVRDDLIDMGCIAVTVAVAIAVEANDRSAFRVVVGVIFALYVPGRSVVSNWPRMAARSNVAASVLFSLSILTLLATGTLWAGYWHPLGLLEIESVFVGVVLFTGLLRRRRMEPVAAVFPLVTQGQSEPHDLQS